MSALDKLWIQCAHKTKGLQIFALMVFADCDFNDILCVSDCVACYRYPNSQWAVREVLQHVINTLDKDGTLSPNSQYGSSCEDAVKPDLEEY